VIVDDGMRRMLRSNEDVFYYVTVTNENEAQPSMPKDAREGILRGMHCVIAYTALAEVYAGKKTADEMRELAAKLELDLDKPLSTSV
jgi:pyruvate dehydrogenase complex dehydrogenase (E1) component